MKHLLTAIACCLAVAGSAQSDGYPFNPDADADGIIGVADLLALLSDFGFDAELETCFRGEAYYADIWHSVPLQNIIHIPADAGLVECKCTTTYCKYRMPSSIPNGTVVYVAMNRDYYYSNWSFQFQSFVGDAWTTFYSHSAHGDKQGKLVFDNGVWSGADYESIILPRSSE